MDIMIKKDSRTIDFEVKSPRYSEEMEKVTVKGFVLYIE